jgi:nitrite reductase (NADH) small subunit
MSDTSIETNVGHLDDIPPGEGREFRAGPTTVTIFHTRDGEVFATQPDCPHKGGPLRDGLVDGATVMCPLHDRIFEFRTGRGLGNDCSIRIYPVRVTDEGALLVTAD